ncbi:MAG: hypothetical protein IJ068_01050 [Bacilli bacterium]|nr:hypothetical protein [Bacilli bacterium]
MIKLLVVIYNKEKRLKLIFQKYNLNYKVVSNATGTANSKILEYLGLNGIKKNVYYTLIDSAMEDYIFNDLKLWCNINKKGMGIGFTISLSSSSKFIKDSLESGDIKMNSNKKNYELIVTIVSTGFSDEVMQASLAEGCSGGTVIKGRSIGSHGTMFLDISLEPEKEIVLNIVPTTIKKQVMERITKECGIKTEARGVVISMPLDNVVGI